MTGWAVLAAFLVQSTPTGVEAPRVTFRTDWGNIRVELDVVQAPVTSCNFLRYVQAGRMSRGSFFRTVISGTDDNPNPIDVIQAATRYGSDDPGFGPIPLERTRDTGLRHVAGTISMARDGPDTATSSFFIVARDSPSLDYGGARNPDGQGFAAFGRVVSDMGLIRIIQRSRAVDEKLIRPLVFRQVYITGGYSDWCAVDADGFITGPKPQS